MSQGIKPTGVRMPRPSGRGFHPVLKWILWILVGLLIVLTILCFCFFPPTHVCVRCPLHCIPLWGWILGLLPSLIILNHTLYLGMVGAGHPKGNAGHGSRDFRGSPAIVKAPARQSAPKRKITSASPHWQFGSDYPHCSSRSLGSC